MNMTRATKRFAAGIIGVLLMMFPAAAGAYDIPGLTGTSPNPVFDLTTGRGSILTGDGNSVPMWMFAGNGGTLQYPGPTLIVNQGDHVTLRLTNNLVVPVSIVIPGIEVTATAVAGTALPGMLTAEVPGDGGATMVSYEFDAAQPGTYLYHSGTNPAMQVELGLFGAIIVRPAGYDAVTNRIAYADPETAYDHEVLFLMSDVDVRIHNAAAVGDFTGADFSDFHSVYWFLNGRNLPDTLAEANTPYLKYQPYNAIVLINPGQRVLYRMISAGRQGHPLHTHGNHHIIIAKDGHFLSTGAGADLSRAAFTSSVFPGETVDAIMTWTGANMGWDIYGHAADEDNPPTGNFPGVEDVDHNGNGILDPCPAALAGEDVASHCLPIPVVLPNIQDMTFGQFFSGSPFLGAFGALPPGEGGFNAYAGYFFMQHSHNEKELTNNDIFPGGLGTFLVIVPPSVPIQ